MADGETQTTTTTTTDTPWYTGQAAELIGHYQNKGWDKMTAAEAAAAAATAHREAERYIGVPADQVVRLPKDASDADGLNALHLRLGRPQAATDYKFDSVKFSDGSAPDNGFADTIRDVAFRSGLSQDRATEVAQGVVKYLDGQKSGQLAEATARLETDRAALRQNWGSNYDAMMLVARNAAAALGVKPEAVAALEGVVGYKSVMELLANVGSKIGEDKFVNSINPNAPGVMTMEQAVAQKRELMNDQAWVKRYMDGGTTENRQMMALNTIIVGDDTEASRRA